MVPFAIPLIHAQVKPSFLGIRVVGQFAKAVHTVFVFVVTIARECVRDTCKLRATHCCQINP